MFLAVGFTSCNTEDEPQIDEISDEVLAQFTDLGFDVSDIQMVNHHNPITGVSSKQYQLEGDILIPESQMREMLDSDIFHVGAVGEQYRPTT